MASIAELIMVGKKDTEALSGLLGGTSAHSRSSGRRRPLLRGGTFEQ